MNEKWYRKGLRFGCTQCGGCCTGGPGAVWVTGDEIARMARFLKLSVEEFGKLYLRRIGNRYALKELPRKNWDCIFLEGKQCKLYSVRPKQCQTFPWWHENLESPEKWAEAAKQCEGIRSDAPLVSYGEIEEQLARKGSPSEISQ